MRIILMIPLSYKQIFQKEDPEFIYIGGSTYRRATDI